MGAYKHMTTKQMQLAWELHEKEFTRSKIADVLGVSVASVQRVVRIMKDTQNGDFEAIERTYPSGCEKIKKFAAEYFGVATKQEKKAGDPPDMTKQFVVGVLSELREINAQLKKLCEELGVK